jgi:hypothetical protein
MYFALLLQNHVVTDQMRQHRVSPAGHAENEQEAKKQTTAVASR